MPLSYKPAPRYVVQGLDDLSSGWALVDYERTEKSQRAANQWAQEALDSGINGRATRVVEWWTRRVIAVYGDLEWAAQARD